MAMLIGAAAALKAGEKELQGTVKLIFQPGEEGFAGARHMVDEGVLIAIRESEHTSLSTYSWCVRLAACHT
jgi:metal-dependent amidase/aminoacylase/carboxypeptidase family protein